MLTTNRALCAIKALASALVFASSLHPLTPSHHHIITFPLAAVAQDAPKPIVSHSFEENDGGWKSIGGSGVVSVTHNAADVKSGKGALQFTFDLKKGEFSILVLPTPDMALARAKSLGFWIKSDHSTPFAVVIQEKDGGRFNAMFSAQKDTWQKVELSTADFNLDTGKDAPKDADGKLDIDKAENVGMIDLAWLFVQADPAVATAFGISEGKRTIYVDDFTVSPTPLAPASTIKAGEGSFDTFARPQIAWIALGEVQASRTTGKPLEGPGVQLQYHQAAAKVAGLSRYIPVGSLAGASKIGVSAASLKPAKIILQVEEKGGGKYNTVIELPGNSGRADLTVSLADAQAGRRSQPSSTVPWRPRPSVP